MDDHRTILTEYVHTIAQTFLDAGVTEVVISPGSRSTPLAYIFSHISEFNTYIQIDERSAGFFALGLAKAKKSPVLLLCTSGTAAANYFPAIVEANYARVPLIVLTADRPHELREVGAPQAINQIQLYGNQVKWSVDFPLADSSEETIPFVERHTARAIAQANAAPMGPVHINIPFREPLSLDFDFVKKPSTFIKSMTGVVQASEEAKLLVSEKVNNAKKGLIIVGELPKDFSHIDFWTFAQSLKWPILADPLSQLRSRIDEECEDYLIDQYDALLKNERFSQSMIPDVVIRFGAQPVSKPLSLFLKAQPPETFIIIDENSIFRDSLGVVTHHIHSVPEVFWKEFSTNTTNEYLNKWTQANALATSKVHQYINEESDEGAYAGVLFEHLADSSDLICGSSMPIRDVDTFFNQTSKDIGIFANRGTNGIDGVVSTALGIQQSRKRPATLLIGDISFLHDVNGLLVSRFHKTDLTIVVMNNDGGGIFSYLPQSNDEQYFEKLFGTPTGLSFDAIAHMYEAEYFLIESKAAFLEALKTPKQTDIRIIEVKTNRQENVKSHRQLWKTINEEIDQRWNN
jgi:2-succinyl-5-enolpyruvyl-6-hydroxy-3-cyclohexene-1-carboxylate synthase